VAIFDRALVRLLPAVPKGLVQRLAERYIAGPAVGDAARVVGELNVAGKAATVDVLGEEITSPDEARAFTDAYEDVLAVIKRRSLDSTISVKLTALGLKLDRGLCRANLEEVVRDAAGCGNFVTIDMEDSSTTDDTLELYRELRSSGQDNVGVVLQATLRRTVAGLGTLLTPSPPAGLADSVIGRLDER